ncbi:diguanylate cyclase [Paenibacillus chartarius]|uniref:Diguanylate cyclase n=1 Tax=Paenibacillus chartarius TaxID=747481 RepID=A0ABV6DQ49_9BACL
MIFTTHDMLLFAMHVLVFPVAKMIGVIVLLEWYVRKQYRYADYVLLAGVNVLIGVIILALYELPMVLYILIIPILISLYYYRIKIIVFALVQALISVPVLISASSGLRASLTLSNMSLLIALLLCTALIINNLRVRGFNLVQDLLAATREMQELQTKNVLMEKMNRIDPATELYNHKSFHEHLNGIFSLDNPAGLDVHLAIIDIDSFKQVNDTFGHSVGDAIIAFVAGQMKAFLESNDFASRYGGEEFAVLTVEKPTDKFYGQLERIRQSIQEKAHPELQGRHISVSIGVQKLLPGMTKEELFNNADAALYTAKKNGKNRTIIAGYPEDAHGVERNF